MSDVRYDPVPAARRLADLWRNLQQVDRLPDPERPRTMDEGYALQHKLMAALGEPVRGYKVGLASAAARERSGLGCPIFGFVPQSRVHRSGATIDLPPGGLLIEAEVAFILPDDFASTSGRMLRACLVYEVVRSRFTKQSAGDLPSFVGDASGFHALVVGDEIPLQELPDLLGRGAAIRHKGKVVAGPLTGRDRPEPLETLERFRELAGNHNFPLAPGMIVATGSIVAPLEIDEAGLLEATLGMIGVRMTIK